MFRNADIYVRTLIHVVFTALSENYSYCEGDSADAVNLSAPNSIHSSNDWKISLALKGITFRVILICAYFLQISQKISNVVRPVEINSKQILNDIAYFVTYVINVLF